jgi:WD40 repeat protein
VLFFNQKTHLGQGKLSKPSVNEKGQFCCCLKTNSSVELLVGSIKEQGENISKFCLEQAPRDIHWVHPKKLLAAFGSEFRLLSIGDSNQLSTHTLPVQHTDDIREISVSPHEPELILSGGFDRKLILTNIAQQKHVKEFHNRHVVGSVRWHPSCDEVVSFTCDVGSINLFDIRENSARLPVIYHSNTVVC